MKQAMQIIGIVLIGLLVQKGIGGGKNGNPPHPPKGTILIAPGPISHKPAPPPRKIV